MANLASVTKYFPTPKEGFITTLGSSILSGATTVPLNSTSGLTNGDVFVGLIEPGQTNEQCFTGTVNTAGNQITDVKWTTGALVAHSAGATIVDYVTSTTVGMISKGILQHANQDGSLTNAAVKAALGITADPAGSWNLLDGGTPTVSSVTANGTGSYDITFASNYATTLSNGMRLKTTRTVAAPNQCTDLDSASNQSFSRASASINGMSFTNNFTVSAWIKISSYSATPTIVSRQNTSNGWKFYISTTGTLGLAGYNTNTSNYARVVSYQSIPRNRWVHVAGQLDMTSTTTTGGTANYLMINGDEIPAVVERGGTNPTSLTQAGDLEIGTAVGSNRFSGKVAQVAIYSAKVSQGTIRNTISQGLLGSETSLISAYSLSGASGANDLNTGNANNLTANGSPVATTTATDSPFGCQADGTVSSTIDYSIITRVNGATITVQTPEGCTIPSTGGISGVSYATVKVPYGFPSQRSKWFIENYFRQDISATVTVSTAWVAHTATLTLPVGSWEYGMRGNFASQTTGATSSRSSWVTLASTAPSTGVTSTIDGGGTNTEFPIVRILNSASGTTSAHTYAQSTRDVDLTSKTTYTSYGASDSITVTETVVLRASQGAVRLFAYCAYL